MSPSIRPFLLRASLLLLAPIAACSTSSAAFVDAQSGYSVTRGKLLRVDGLVSESLVRLGDGVAFNIDGTACKVALSFGDGSKRVLELGEEDVLVCGVDMDYVLQPVQHSGGRPAAK